jgi:hypothetical protein
MATLTNPIRKQNIVDRFADFVVSHNNTQVVWGTNNKPFTQMPDAVYGGTTTGRAIGITGTDITGSTIDTNIRNR